MLVLPRKTTQAIRIGDKVTIKILRIQGKKVHIGIDAPKEVLVHRQEIYQNSEEKEELET